MRDSILAGSVASDGVAAFAVGALALVSCRRSTEAELASSTPSGPPVVAPAPSVPTRLATQAPAPAQSAGDVGLLSVDCSRPCDEVRLDGELLGMSPIERHAAPPGVHRLALRSGSIEKSFEVEIHAGLENHERVGMNEEPKPIHEGSEEDTLRAELQDKISAGAATKGDLRELLGICGRMHDRSCVVRTRKLLDAAR